MDTKVFGLFQFIIVIAYVISSIVAGVVYSIRRNHIPEDDFASLKRLDDSFMPAWIIIGVLGALIFLSLWVACFTGDGLSCFFAVIWTLFR